MINLWDRIRSMEQRIRARVLPVARAVADPPAGFGYLFVDQQTGKLAMRSSDGTTTRYSAGGGGGAPSGAAGGDLGGTYPDPEVTQARGLRETSGPTTLTVGAVADGAFLRRIGSDVVGVGPDPIPTTDLEIDLNADEGVTIATGVSAWASQVGSLVASQATGSKQPTVVDWGYNGHSAIHFDGSDDILRIPYAAALDAWTTITVYVVSRYVPSSSDGFSTGLIIGRAVAQAGTSPFHEWSVFMGATTTLDCRANGTQMVGTLPSSATVFTPAAYTMTCGAGGASSHYNGRRLGSTGVFSIAYTDTTDIGIGASAVTTETSFYRGDIARILVYSAQHTPAQRFAVLSALALEYGLPAPVRSLTV